MKKKCDKCGEYIEMDCQVCENCGAIIEDDSFIAAMKQAKNATKVETKKEKVIYRIMGEGILSMVFGVLSLIFGIVSVLTFGALIIPQMIALFFGTLSEYDRKMTVISIIGVALASISFLPFIIAIWL